MNLRQLESQLKFLRNKVQSEGAYPVKTHTDSILNFINKHGKPISYKDGNETKTLYLDKEEKYSKYYNIQNTADIIQDNLDVVCMAYDSEVDRHITWFKEPWRVPSYEKSLRHGSHVGTIGLIDLKTNIESFELLKKDEKYWEYAEEIQAEIDYWKSYYYEADGKTVKFRYYVIIGKNRSLFALPMIYETHINKGNLKVLSELEIDFKIWTKFVSREFKTELYRNEKNNMKDTELQELIGWGGPITQFIHRYPMETLSSKVFKEFFTDEHFLMIKDRELLVDLYAVYCKKYGGEDGSMKNWITTHFEKQHKVADGFKKSLDFYMKVNEAWINARLNGELKRWSISSGHAWRVLLFSLCCDIMNSQFKIDLTGNDLFKKIIEFALETRADLEDDSKTFAFLSDGTPMSPKRLMTGLKGSTCVYNKDFTPFDNNFKWDETKVAKSKQIISGYQYTVMTNIFFDLFWKKVGDAGIMVLPAKRGFEPSEVSYIVKRDECRVRINGEVYNSNNEPIRFSDEHPDDEYILKYGTESDYVTLSWAKLMGDDVQIDHIPAYTKNKERRDLDKCEATTSGFNKWKNDREAVYENEILEDITYRKSMMPKTIENFA